MKKSLKALYIIAFLFIILVPLITLNTERHRKSDIDNRELVEFPDAFEESNLHVGVEKYLQDRIGLRRDMMSGYSLINRTLYGELAHPLYQYGQDGYVFFNMHNNIVYEDYHRSFAEAVQKMQNYCESRGAKFYFLFNPEKISVYRRFLPEGVNYDDTWVDKMLSYMDDLGINIINNKELLRDLSYTEQVFNRQYDAGHWNDLGCFYGTNNLWGKMGKDFPAITPYTKEEFEITTKTEKYYPVSSITVYEDVPVYNLKTKLENKTKSYAELELNEQYRYFEYNINQDISAQRYPKVMFFQGSYYNRASQFLFGRTKEYIGIHDYQNVLNLDYYFNIFQPDAVVFEVAEYTLSNGYFDSKQMQSIDYNPQLELNMNEELNQEKSFPGTDEYIHIIPGDGFDVAYFDANLLTAKYVYLDSGEKIYDMFMGKEGNYYAAIPHNVINDTAKIIYEDYYGEKHWIDEAVQNAQSYVKDITYTQEAYYDKWNNEYVFQTSLFGNRFSSVNLQILDGTTNAFVKTVFSAYGSGEYNDSFIHTNESGWYIIRLKANSNKKDEGLDILVYLVKGERYYFSFDVSELTSHKVCIKRFKFYGACPWKLSETELMNDPDKTGGCAELSDKKYRIYTNIEGNRFSCVVLNLINVQTGELIDPISIEYLPGDYNGKYVHEAPSGEYMIKYRGNTNLQDEWITASAYLQEGMIYKWNYSIDSIDPAEIQISNISFLSVGYSD